MGTLKEDKTCYFSKVQRKDPPFLMPPMFKEVDFQDFVDFYINMAKWIYGLFRPGASV